MELTIPLLFKYSSFLLPLYLFRGFINFFRLGGICLLFWPLVAIHLGFFEFYQIIKPGLGTLVAGYIACSVPLLVMGLAVFLHWVGKGRAFSVLLAIIGNAFIGGYNIWLSFLRLEALFPRKMGSGFITFMNQQNWVFLGFSILPLLAAVLGARYLWSHTNFIKHIKEKIKSHNYGNAKLANLKILRKINTRKGLPIGIIPELENFDDPIQASLAIQNQEGGKLLRLNPIHTTVVAPSRAGKGVGLVIPTLLDYQGPVFVIDIKGENYCVTARSRRERGRTVVAFDPYEITGSDKVRINPLDYLDPCGKRIVDDTAVLANLLCPNYAPDGTDASYFQAQAGTVIHCLLLYVVCSKDIEAVDRNLSKVYDLLTLPENELIELLTDIGRDTSLAYGTPTKLANRIVSTHHEERSGILNSAFKELRFLDTPYVRECIAISDVKLFDITKGNLDLFVCIPPDILETQSRLLRLLTGVVFLEMVRVRGKIGEHNLLMLIDEMPTLGYMKQIEQVLVYGGGYGVSLMTFSQSIELIRGVYPKSWETIIANQLSIFFGCTDLTTIEYLSKMIGTKTVDTNSSNKSAGVQTKSMDFLGTSSKQTGDSVSETGRPLLLPQEIKDLGNKVILAFFGGENSIPPIMCRRINYQEQFRWKKKFDVNPLHGNRKVPITPVHQKIFEKFREIIKN